jgi:hypothetical protein
MGVSPQPEKPPRKKPVRFAGLRICEDSALFFLKFPIPPLGFPLLAFEGFFALLFGIPVKPEGFALETLGDLGKQEAGEVVYPGIVEEPGGFAFEEVGDLFLGSVGSRGATGADQPGDGVVV